MVRFMCVYFFFGFVSLSVCAQTQQKGSRRPCLDLRDNFRIFGHGSTGNTASTGGLIFHNHILLNWKFLGQLATRE